MHHYETARIWLRNTPDRKIDRMAFGEIFGRTWDKAATFNNACSALLIPAVWCFFVDLTAISEESFPIANAASGTSSNFVANVAAKSTPTLQQHSPGGVLGR